MSNLGIESRFMSHPTEKNAHYGDSFLDPARVPGTLKAGIELRAQGDVLRGNRGMILGTLTSEET